MRSKVGVTGSLKDGDVIEVMNALMGSSFYEVYKIEGNKVSSKDEAIAANKEMK